MYTVYTPEVETGSMEQTPRFTLHTTNMLVTFLYARIILLRDMCFLSRAIMCLYSAALYICIAFYDACRDRISRESEIKWIVL